MAEKEAWVEGCLFGYYIDRGYSVSDSLAKAKEPIPAHLTEDIPIWNPYDPTIGCCSTCSGRGADGSGPCWDCRGTGHPHPDPEDCP